MFIRVCKYFFFFLESLTPGSGAWLIDMLLGPQCAIEFFYFHTQNVVNGLAWRDSDSN